MTLFIASDHAGIELKQQLIAAFSDSKELLNMPATVLWKDLGPQSKDSVDYPDFADKVVQSLKSAAPKPAPSPDTSRTPHAVTNFDHLGILICGSGQGMAIRANRFKHIRAALCFNPEMAKLSREHNNANVLCMGARATDLETAKKIVQTFVQTSFEGGRHEQRVRKLSEGC